MVTLATSPKIASDYARVPLGAISTRPELFQPRDVPGGRDTDPERVRQIVQRFNPGRFEAIVVARDPARRDAYIVIAGHHRLEAAKQVGVKDVPIRVLPGNIADPAVRQKLATEADLSNYGISAPGVIEQTNTVRRLRAQGWEDQRIADEMRVRRSRVDELGAMGAAGQQVLHLAAQHRQLQPIAAEVGMAVEKGWANQEEAQAIFMRVHRDFETTGKVPNRYVLRQKLLDSYNRAQTRSAASGRLAGFDESALVAQITEDAKTESARAQEQNTIRRQLTACQALADELGVDVSEVKRAADTRLDQLTPEQEKRAREELAPETPGSQETPPADSTSGVTLFGDVQPYPAPSADVDQDLMPWERPDYEPARPAAAGPPPERQATMGDEFATNRTLQMMETPGGPAPQPLIDPVQEKARAERRDVLASGGTDMFETAPQPKKFRSVVDRAEPPKTGTPGPKEFRSVSERQSAAASRECPATPAKPTPKLSSKAKTTKSKVPTKKECADAASLLARTGSKRAAKTMAQCRKKTAKKKTRTPKAVIAYR